MSELEKKFCEYLLKRYGYLSKKAMAKNLAEVTAHDLAGIAEKEIEKNKLNNKQEKQIDVRTK